MITPPRSSEKAITLALTLAQAESAIEAFAAGQIDAIMDADGKTYLLRPAQERLRQNERRLQAMIESAADVITVVDRAGVILSQSGAVWRVLGYGPEELVGRSVFDIVREDDFPRLYSAFMNVIEDLLVDATVEFHHRTRDGSYRMLEATVSRLRDVSVFGVVLICRDTTQRQQAQDEATRREVACTQDALTKDRFLAMLSHELRTPLTPVLLGVDELGEDERFAEARPTLAMMRRNIHLQSRLLEELTDFTTVDQHKVRLRLESIDAHEAVRFVLEICRSEITAARIEVLLDLRASERMVVADSVRLQQVMWNLLRNAIKFSTPGGSISITSANAAPGGLAIEFIDHGVGIEPGLLPLVFDPFQQGDRSMQQRYGGLGLGLFIAKGLAEAQGGTLTASSEGRGKGATFRMTLNKAATSDPQENGADKPLTVATMKSNFSTAQ